MPGPIIQNQPLPWWADPEGSSVTEPLWQTLARRSVGAVKTLGLDDPMNGAMPLTAIEGPAGKASGSIITELRNLLKNSTGRELIPEATGHAPTDKIVGMLEEFNPTKPLTRKATEREMNSYTGYMLPKAGELKAPAGMEFGGPSANLASSREPLLAERYAAQQEAIKKAGPALKQTVANTVDSSGAGSAIRQAMIGKRSNLRMNEAGVRAIKDLVAGGADFAQLQAANPGVSPSTLREIVRGDSWSWVKPTPK